MGTWNTAKLMAALEGLDAELVHEFGEDYVTIPVADREAIHIDSGHAPGHHEELAYSIVYLTYGTPTRWDDGNSSTDVELAMVDDEELVAAVVKAAMAKRAREMDAEDAAMNPGQEGA